MLYYNIINNYLTKEESAMSFVNYTPSKERTDRNTNEAFMKYGKDIVIINGEDNFNACKIFHIDFLLEKFGIEKVGDFHDGISGISNSGCIIKKTDFNKFIEKFNKRKWELRRSVGPGQMFLTERIRIFDPEVNEWKVFFEMKYGDTQYEKEKHNGMYHCRRQATCTINNFKNCKKDMSYYFTNDSTQLFWKKVDKF
jgi:hypothetical protein